MPTAQYIIEQQLFQSSSFTQKGCNVSLLAVMGCVTRFQSALFTKEECNVANVSEQDSGGEVSILTLLIEKDATRPSALC